MMTIKIIKRGHIRFRIRRSKSGNRNRKRNNQSRDKGGEALNQKPLLFLHFATTFHDIE